MPFTTATRSNPSTSWWRRVAVALTMVMMWCLAAPALAQGSSKFDHLKTGFPLTGAHTTVRCESCHTSGVFKGTPKDCRTCHSPGGKQSQNAVLLPGNHIPTTLSCESCHGTQSFTSVKFSHTTGISAGQSCAACHDGVHAQGKSATHITTTAGCESCHKTAAWDGAKPPHDGFNASTNCASCHNGSGATGKASGHIPVSANCFSCHAVSGWKPTKWAHTQVAVKGVCSTCHSGSYPPADGKPGNHIPYASLTGVNVSNCDSCHTGGYSSWNPGKFHSNVTVSTQCATCHLSGAYGLTAKPSDTIHSQVTGGCETCHSSTNSWTSSSSGAGIKVDHSTFNASTNCASCHNGSTATGKASTHMPTFAAPTCFSCHGVTNWTTTKWAHSESLNKVTVKGVCSTCHSGSYPPADGKPADHIPYAGFSATASANCDSCHTSGTYTSWNPGKLHANFAFSTGCASCHNGSYNGPDPKPGNHIPYASVTAAASAGCETCHKGSLSGFSSWATGKFHSSVTTSTQCASCHLTTAFGLSAKPNDATHTGVTGNCENCHKTTTAWTMTSGPGKPDHTGFTTCQNCHNGSTATGKVSTHIPTNVDCVSCHSTSAFAPASKWNHTQVNVKGACSTCHNGSYAPADGKPGDHIPYASFSNLASANCDTCHKGGYTSWNPGKLHANASFTTGCATCHNGAYNGPDAKSGNHIPYASVTAAASAGCETCHKGSLSGFSSWATGQFHSSVTTGTQCASCHLTTAYGQSAKPNDATHTGVTGNCESCHKTTSAWTMASGSGKPDHTSFTTCQNCHNGSTATGKISTHIPVTADCVSCHSTSAFAPASKWNHTQVAVKGVCSTCHSGSFPPADGKPADHIPYASIAAAASANCDSCHKGGYTSWNPGKFHASFPSVSTQCATCHTGAFNGPDPKPGNHIPYASVTAAAGAGCETCHKGSLSGFTSWATGQFHSSVTTSTQCASCHLTTAYGLTAKPNNAAHSAVTGSCEQCHKTAGSWAVKVPHDPFNAGTNCAACHDGSSATGKTTTHIPTTANCFSCHGVSTWTPTKWNHTQATVKGVCSTCHTGGYAPADGKPANHIPYASVTAAAAANCDTCHKGGYTSWNPGQFHANVVTSTQCATCHLSTAYALTAKPNDATHTGVTGNCESCHKSTASWSSGTKVDHSGFTASTNCANCHNGSSATGKTNTHIPTTANCLSCHGTTAWTPTKWNHTQVVVASACSTCHTGSYAPADGKPGNHIPYASISATSSANCDKCHTGSPYTSWANGKLHTSFPAVTTQCATCHTGSYLGPDGKVGNHIPYASVTASASAGCETCHKGSYTSWATGKFHSSVTTSTQCASCHLTTAYGQTGKPATALHSTVTGNCESCHKSTTDWAAGAKVDHTGFNASTTCSTCHNGSSATGKTNTHIPTTANCFSCHGTTAWTPTKWNHTQVVVASACSTCHTGSYVPADGKPGNHIPYAAISATSSANCDKCHTGSPYTSWANGKLHTSFPAVTTQCATCHTGSYLGPDGKVGNHIPYASVTASASAGCETCHKGSYTSWATGKFHSSVTTSTQCASCHLTSAYGQTGKPANALHSTVTGNCESCHKSTVDWSSGTKVDHSTFTAATTCTGCHNGSTATGKVSNHIPTTANCFSCHSTTAFTPTKWNHTQTTVASACSTCHTGAYLGPDGKPSNHIPYATITASASANCDKCHTSSPYSNWANGKFHTAFPSVTTQCATCHTGAYNGPDGKSANHIPYATVAVSASAGCEACHKSTTTWTTGKFHSYYTVTSQCNTCHNSSAYGQTIKPSNHIPLAQLLNGTTMDCSACHTSTAAGGFASATMNHNNSMGSGSGSCKACHLTGTSYLGSMEKKSTSHMGGKTDCSTSGCHKPLGNRGTAYRSW
jgi:nitrate/TMAO reductase-like tetraheme cytochrome c subunit